MGALLSYSLQASVLMILLFAAYKLFLSATTFHSFKRLTLLSILVASWLIPFALPEYERPAENSPEAATAAVSTACKGTIEIGVPIEIKDAGAGQDEVASVSSRPFWSAARIVYLTGILVVALYTLISLARLVWIIRNGTRQRVNGVDVLISTFTDGPFSWAGYVVVRPEDCDENLPLVIRHEMCHLRHGHWCDTLVAQANMILLWFNPVSYLIFSELKNIHEYEADSAIKPEQIRRYQLMLIKKAVGSGFPTLANSLNHSQIKIRITMMMKTKSCSARRFAALALPGAAVAGLFILSQPAVARVLDSVRNSDVSEEFVGKISQNQAEKQIADAVDMLMPGYVDATAEDMVIQELADDKAGEAFPVLLVTGDDEVVQEKASEAPAYFVNGKLFTEPINTLNPSDIKSMAVVKNDPEYPQGKIMIELKDAEHVYIATEETATYQDGMSALIDFLIQNLQYPESLKSPVRVIVQFTVTKDGGIEDCKIIRSGGAEADEEAIRVVKLTSGKWIPAVAGNGERVSSRFVLPINFKPSAE